MSRNVPAPYFPIPPGEYSQRYFAEVIRAFSVYLEQARNPGEGRNTSMVFTNLQSNDVGLEPGAVFEVDGVLRIARLGASNPAGTSGAGIVGTVTVVVS